MVSRGASLSPPTALWGDCSAPFHAPGQGPPPTQGPQVAQPTHLLKDAVVPYFVAGFVPHDQNLQGEKQAAVECRLTAVRTSGELGHGD